MVEVLRGEEAWQYDTLCILCRGTIRRGDTVYRVGMHVFHKPCLEWLLRLPKHRFEEVLKQLPLDTHEELRKLYETKSLPQAPAKPQGEKPPETKPDIGVHPSRSIPEMKEANTFSFSPPHEDDAGEEPPERKPLPRWERKRLWRLARKIVDEALKAAGCRHPADMRVDGMGPDYARFLLELRKRIQDLLKEPRRLEMRIDTYGQGYGDTHIYIDNEYLYTWRPEFDTKKSSFWGWVKRVYNLLKTLAEMGLLKEEKPSEEAVEEGKRRLMEMLKKVEPEVYFG